MRTYSRNIISLLLLADVSLQFDCLPNGVPISNFSRGHPSSPRDSQHPSDSSVASARYLSRMSRSRSPPARLIDRRIRLPSSDGLGYALDQLPFIRVTPIMNMNRVFEFRRYSFPADKGIEIRVRRNIFRPVSTQEQIVLSTYDGEVLAILMNIDTFCGLYHRVPQHSYKGRAKINIASGRLTRMTKEEVKEAPVGPTRPILLNFKVERISRNTCHIELLSDDS